MSFSAISFDSDKCYQMNSLDFIGHVVLVVSSSLENEHKPDADTEEEDETEDRSNCCANNHSNLIG